MQPLIEHQVSIGRERAPGSEGAWLVTGLGQCTILVMDILAVLATAGVAVVVEQRLELVDVIGRQGKVVALAKLALGRQSRHLLAGITVEAVAAHHGGMNALTGKHATENLARGSGACP